MKRYVLPVFLTLLFLEVSWTCKGQAFESTYLNLLKKELRALSYRDLTVPYTLQYDSLQMGYIFQSAQLSIDSTLHARVEDQLNALPRTTTTSYKGTIRFDNYTDAIFIRSEVVGGGALLINYMHVMAEPPDGIQRFIKRWGSFLDSLKAMGKFDEKRVDPDCFVYVVVEVDGSLVCRDTSEAGQLLREFIRGEKPWRPGIMNGRPLLQSIALQVPSRGTDYDKLKYRQYGGLHARININGEEKIVYFDYKLLREKEVRTMLSAVYENGNYVAPVFHKGPLDELQQMVAFLKEERVNICYYNPYMVNRVYFYTLDY